MGKVNGFLLFLVTPDPIMEPDDALWAATRKQLNFSEEKPGSFPFYLL